MRSTALLLIFLCVPRLALADACRDEIAALMQGPLDPFQRPPHQQETVVYDPDGAIKWEMLSLIETPLRTIAGQPSANWFTMAIGERMWNGPSTDGPWSLNAAGMPGDRAETMAEDQMQMTANLTDTECLGPDDMGRLIYVYRTQTDPGADGAFYGALHRVALDPDLGQIVAFDQTEFVNSWSEGISMDRWVITVTFDDAIKVTAPE